MRNIDLAIVIPAYKATFLRETLESIACQTDKRFHLYIGDDCSPYDLKSIVDEFRDRIPLTYKRFETNLGSKDLVAQWERCIKMTQGEPYLWLFSDDDVMGKDCVATFLNLPKDIKDNSLCHFDINCIDDLNGHNVRSLSKFPKKFTAGEYLKAKLTGQVVSFVVEFIFPRSLYEKVGGFQNFDLAWGSDFMTWLKMAAGCSKGIVTISDSDDSLVSWRRSDENISPNFSRPIALRKAHAAIRNAIFIKNFFKTNPKAMLPVRYSFRWVRFPLGWIWRNRRYLSNKDILILLIKYIRHLP